MLFALWRTTKEFNYKTINVLCRSYNELYCLPVSRGIRMRLNDRHTLWDKLYPSALKAF